MVRGYHLGVHPALTLFFLHEAIHKEISGPIIKEELDPKSERGAKVECLQAGVNEGVVEGVEGLPEINGNDQ